MFDHVYFGVQRDKAREDWTKTIDQIMALKPEVIVPGHEGPGAKHDVSAIAFMKKYIADWDANVAKSKNATEMRENVLNSIRVWAWNLRSTTASKHTFRTQQSNIFHDAAAGVIRPSQDQRIQSTCRLDQASRESPDGAAQADGAERHNR